MISPSQKPLPDNTQHSKERDINDPEGFEPAIPASEQPQNHAYDRAATGIGIWNITYVNINLSSQWRLQTANCHLSLHRLSLFPVLSLPVPHAPSFGLPHFLPHTHPSAVGYSLRVSVPCGFSRSTETKCTGISYLFYLLWSKFSLLSMSSTVNCSVKSGRPLYNPFQRFKPDYSISSNSRHSASVLTSDKLKFLRRLLTIQSNYFRSVSVKKEITSDHVII